MFLFGTASALHAATAPVTFAQAIESSANTNANVFAYNDNGIGSDAELGTSTGAALGAAVPINFIYLSGAGIPLADTDLTGLQNATISMDIQHHRCGDHWVRRHGRSRSNRRQRHVDGHYQDYTNHSRLRGKRWFQNQSPDCHIHRSSDRPYQRHHSFSLG